MSALSCCPMCGAPLDPEAQMRACGRCPLFRLTRGCALRLVRCPNCGYHSLPGEARRPPDPAQEVDGGSMTVPSATGVRLSELAEGKEALLLSATGLDGRSLQRLVAYGLVPGVRLKVLQRRPATILKVYQTELALESALAEALYVAAEPAQETPADG